MARIREQLASIRGKNAVQDDARRVVTFYHEVIFKPSIGNSLKFGVEREMKTLAVALDSLLEGSLGRTGDLLIARYKALEESVRSGHWDVAAELEAVPVQEGGLTSEAEMLRATQTQARKLKLQQALAAIRGARPGIG